MGALGSGAGRVSRGLAGKHLGSADRAWWSLSSLSMAFSWREACALLILLGYALRVCGLGAQELRGDEAFSYDIARLPIAQIFAIIVPAGEPHSPLHFVLLRGWMLLAGDSEFALRYLAAAWGVLTLAFAYQLGRRTLGPRYGLLFATLLALAESLVWLGQDLRNQYVLAIGLAVLATLLLVRALEGAHWSIWIAYAIVASLTVYSHYYGAFVFVGHAAYLLCQRRGRKLLGAWLLAGLGALALFAPWLYLTLPHLLGQNFTEPSQPETWAYLRSALIELTIGSGWQGKLARWASYVALAPVLAGVVYLLKRRPAWLAASLGWLVTALAVIYVVRLRRLVFNKFYFDVAAPAWWLLLAAGIEAAWQQQRVWIKTAAWVALSILVAGNLVSLAHYYWDPERSRSEGYRAVAQWIATRSEAHDLFIAHFPEPRFDYYLRHVAIPKTMLPESADTASEVTQRALEDLAAQYDRLWFVPVYHSHWDPDNVVGQWLDENCLLEQRVAYGNLTLLAYRPEHTWNRALSPVRAQLDERLELDGVLVTVDGQPVQDLAAVRVPAGATLQVTLRWRALGTMARSYTVFVHLQGEDGTLISQHDGLPAEARQPTWSWKVGDEILDRHEVTVPAGLTARRGVLVVGLYDSDTLERQRFADGSDAIPLATVTIEPQS